MDVELININKNYGKVTAVDNFSLGIEQGEFLVLLGPSGCGKTTTLRMIAGLENIDEGELLIEGKRMNDVLPKYRDLAMVFQSYALYPHMTVEDNIGYPLKMRGVKGKEKIDAIMLACRQVQISDLTQRYPKQLSGGQRQRVALARALVRRPKVFLMDEPLSNLDAKLRGLMRAELKHLQHKLGITTIYVTHDQIEAMTLADKIVVLNNGLVEQIDTPTELYNNPKTEFVAGFIGSPTMNFLRGDIVDQSGAEVYGVRPEHISLSPTKGKIKCTLKHLENLGADTLYYMQSEDYQQITVRVEGMGSHKKGEVMFLDFDEANVHMFKDGKRV